MKDYTLGFIFNKTQEQVLLIHKNKPESQAGRVNGLGGKYEPGEDGVSCIVREIQEESGLVTQKENWTLVGQMRSQAWTVDVFAYVHQGSADDAQSIEAEKIEWFDVNALPSNSMSNLGWLIAACLDKLKNKKFTQFIVEYP